MNLELLKTIQERRDELTSLLMNGVESGASIGFLPPLSRAQALAYWDGIASELHSGKRLLLVAIAHGRIVGSVQLSLCTKMNGLHRAEVEKLMVHTDHRRSGIGRALVDGIEQLAKEHHRTLLVLDTRTGDVASTLYRKSAYIEAGRIPDYARSASGRLESTTYFYKRL